MEVLNEQKMPLSPSVMKPATFRLVVPRLNQLHTPFFPLHNDSHTEGSSKTKHT